MEKLTIKSVNNVKKLVEKYNASKLEELPKIIESIDNLIIKLAKNGHICLKIEFTCNDLCDINELNSREIGHYVIRANNDAVAELLGTHIKESYISRGFSVNPLSGSLYATIQW